MTQTPHSSRWRSASTLLFVVAGWSALALVLVACTPLAYIAGVPLIENSRPEKCDVVVLLSSNQIDDRWLTADAMQRTMGALAMYREGYGSAIISSGSDLSSGADYAALQARWLELAGVPKEAIVIESKSSRTYESVVEVARIMRSRGWKRALAVTSELDRVRVRLVFEKMHIPVSVLGVPQNKAPHGPFYFPSGPVVLYNAVYEYAGLALYRWRGWI